MTILALDYSTRRLYVVVKRFLISYLLVKILFVSLLSFLTFKFDFKYIFLESFLYPFPIGNASNPLVKLRFRVCLLQKNFFPTITLHFLFFRWNHNFSNFSLLDNFSETVPDSLFPALDNQTLSGFCPLRFAVAPNSRIFTSLWEKLWTRCEKTCNFFCCFLLTEKLIRKTNRELFYSWLCCPGPREVWKCFQRLARYQRYWTRSWYQL